MEPTYNELEAAYIDALNNQENTFSRGETREILIQLRKSKHTWIGKEENGIRFAIDNYLGQYCRCPDGPFHYPQCPFLLGA